MARSTTDMANQLAGNQAGMAELRNLDLCFSTVESLEGLQSLSNLKRLDMNECPVSDLSPLKDLLQLEHLDLTETPVKDLSPLVEWMTTSGVSSGLAVYSGILICVALRDAFR